MTNILLLQKFNKLTTENFAARLKQANVITKTDFDDKLKSLNQKINLNKTKYFLLENEFKKVKTFDSSYFIGKRYFEGDGTQNYLVFQPRYRILTELVVLVVVTILIYGNLKDFPMKILQLLIQVIINSIQN